ncbi:MAG: DUF4832 domain-containing protein [Defluviitaleaceae bacterium]|nr:DUF4832 domain-containing protein [Defluviitaleaceae bacterium]MCL2273752.1 DUF4832 domain-containing protein [Defluviitaleaceae bacterium]
MTLQNLNYTENPIDIPNPDRGAYRGRWQNIPPALVTAENSPYGITPEVDHRVPVDGNDALYHGRQVPPVEGDDIVPTEFFNGQTQGEKPYIGGTGVHATPSISFMGFDLVNFSSNAFLSAEAAFAYQEDGALICLKTNVPRTGKTAPLTAYALDYIRGLLQTVRDGDGTALVKFSYDGNGFNYIEPHKYPHLPLTEGLIRGPEPEGMCDVEGFTHLNWIEYHIHQLSPIFEEFEDIIMCVKTGMVGAWGEQHSSPMSRDPQTYKFLLDAYLKAVPASRSLLTHAGGFLAWYNATYNTQYTFHNIEMLPAPKRGTPEARFGFFNDSYAAGGSDLSDNGSLSEGGEMLCAGDSGYNRYEIMGWLNRQNNFVQGEGGIGDNPFGNMPNAIAEAYIQRTTALNMRHGNYSRWSNVEYNEENIAKIFNFPDKPHSSQVFYDPVYEGKNALEYFRDRMGYRLVLRESFLPRQVETSGVLMFAGKIQNVGFGNVINRKRVSAMLQSKASGECFQADTPLDARDWLTAENGDTRATNIHAWHAVNFEIPMTSFGNVPAGEYYVYLKINDPKEQSINKRCIRFANRETWYTVLGVNLLGSVQVA